MNLRQNPRFLNINYISPPPPVLANPSNSKKFLQMIKNVQPGVSVCMSGEVESVIRNANWEGLVFHLGKHFYKHLMESSIVI